MKKALKNFGLGLLYFFVSPLLLAILAVAMVFGLFVLDFKDLQGLIRFFRGEKTFFEELPEDKKVLEIKTAQAYASTHSATSQGTPAPNNQVYIQQNYYPQQPQAQSPQPSSVQPASYPNSNPPIDVPVSPSNSAIDVSATSQASLAEPQDISALLDDSTKGGNPT